MVGSSPNDRDHLDTSLQIYANKDDFVSQCMRDPYSYLLSQHTVVPILASFTQAYKIRRAYGTVKE